MLSFFFVAFDLFALFSLLFTFFFYLFPFAFIYFLFLSTEARTSSHNLLSIFLAFSCFFIFFFLVVCSVFSRLLLYRSKFQLLSFYCWKNGDVYLKNLLPRYKNHSEAQFFVLSATVLLMCLASYMAVTKCFNLDTTILPNNDARPVASS